MPRSGIDGGKGGPRRAASGLVASAPWRRLLGALIVIVTLASCQSGIGPDPDRPRATIAAYETRVGGLERRVDEQRATLESLTPPPGTPTPVPFAARWRVEVAGRSELRPAVGAADGLTPIAADGVYLIVPIEVTNLTSEPTFFNPFGSMEMVDAAGRHYELDARASDAAYLLDLGLDPTFEPRQPGIVYPDVLAFDVPADAGGFVLRRADEGLAIPLDPLPLGTPPLGTPPA